MTLSTYRPAPALSSLFFTVAITFAGVATPAAAAEDFAGGVRAYKAGDYALARSIFTTLSDRGDARSQFALGLLYDNGEGVAKDPEKARSLYQQGADGGFAKAMYNLALMLERGRGGPKDLTAAHRWYAQAAEAGNRDGLDKLTEFAAAGDPAMQLALGRLHYHGRGVVRDPARALAMFEAAGEGGEVEAMFDAGVLHERSGNLVTAERWYQRAVKAGHVGAMYNLAGLKRAGIGVRHDPQEARRLYLAAAEAGHANAALTLGMLFQQGGAWPQDLNLAERWYQRAAAAGSAAAHVNLAALAADGVLTPATLERIEHHLEKARELGHPLAEGNLAALASYRDAQAAAAP